MYYQGVPLISIKNLFFAGILSATDEHTRIRIRKSMVRFRGPRYCSPSKWCKSGATVLQTIHRFILSLHALLSLYFDPYSNSTFDFDAEPCRFGSATPCTVDSPVRLHLHYRTFIYYRYNTDNLNQSKILFLSQDGFKSNHIDSNDFRSYIN